MFQLTVLLALGGCGRPCADGWTKESDGNCYPDVEDSGRLPGGYGYENTDYEYENTYVNTYGNTYVDTYTTRVTPTGLTPDTAVSTGITGVTGHTGLLGTGHTGRFHTGFHTGGTGL